MSREEAEKYLYYAMTIGEQLRTARKPVPIT